jgi:hypothetical protein
VFEDLSLRAHAVIIVPGTREGILRELRSLKSRALLGKCLFVLPGALARHPEWNLDATRVAFAADLPDPPEKPGAIVTFRPEPPLPDVMPGSRIPGVRAAVVAGVAVVAAFFWAWSSSQPRTATADASVSTSPPMPVSNPPAADPVPPPPAVPSPPEPPPAPERHAAPAAEEFVVGPLRGSSSAPAGSSRHGSAESV